MGKTMPDSIRRLGHSRFELEKDRDETSEDGNLFYQTSC